MKRLVFVLCLFAALTCWDSSVAKAEPGWSGRVIAFGDERARIQSTPVIHRDYRPMHFYGNTVRRRYYHGSALPRPGQATRAADAAGR